MSTVPSSPEPEQDLFTVVEDPENPTTVIVATPTNAPVTVVRNPEAPSIVTVIGADLTPEGALTPAGAETIVGVTEALFHRDGWKYPWCESWPCDCDEREIATQRCFWAGMP